MEKITHYERLKKRKTNLQEELAEMQAAINEEYQREKYLKEELVDLESKIVTSNQLYSELVKENNQVKKDHHSLLKSTSWSVTKPLRAIADKRKKVGLSVTKPVTKPVLPEQEKAIITDEPKGTKKGKRLDKKANFEIRRVKRKMYNLGFEEAGYQEMYNLYSSSNHSKHLRRLAAFELALWHAEKLTKEDAMKSLDFLAQAIAGEKGNNKIRQIGILTAECMSFLGDQKGARKTIERLLESDSHPDIFLAAANLEEAAEERIHWVNQMFNQLSFDKIHINHNTKHNAGIPYDNLVVPLLQEEIEDVRTEPLPKVTVIMPSYNAEGTITTSIHSIMGQEWSNIELIVVDDCSQDDTVKVVKQLMEQDERISLITSEVNRGAYVARNCGLDKATGDFVTINDADDWSHPQKIKVQVEHLIKNPDIIGNTSQQARTTEHFKFHRRGKPGEYIFSNLSSFMFRRSLVHKELGYWDSVRFAGDSEFLKRVRSCFGEESVVTLPTGPLSFQRQSEKSLTGNSVFGYPGYFMGVRKEYLEAQMYFHKRAESLYYDFPLIERPFPIPEPMKPIRREASEGIKHFDCMVAADFRNDGGFTEATIEEIKANQRAGLKTGLFQLASYDSEKRHINPLVREVLKLENVEMVVYGESVSCNLLLLKSPAILQVEQKYIPTIIAEEIRLIVDQPPVISKGSEESVLYDIGKANDLVMKYFGKEPTWHPTSQVLRNRLIATYEDQIENINFSEIDWLPIIDKQKLKITRTAKQSPDSIVIGRYGVDDLHHWPTSKQELLDCYPEGDTFRVAILGGAKTAEEIIGYRPSNWEVYDTEQRTIKAFLTDIDVFVYTKSEQLVVSCDYEIIQAMAAGIPVILPPPYQELFHEAAIYVDSDRMKDTVVALMTNEAAYQDQANKGSQFIAKQCQHSAYMKRISFHKQDTLNE